MLEFYSILRVEIRIFCFIHDMMTEGATREKRQILNTCTMHAATTAMLWEVSYPKCENGWLL